MIESWLNPKIDVIIPTASIHDFPAYQSIPHNMKSDFKYAKNIRFIPIESDGPNFSFSKSINEGLRERRKDAYVFLLNDDCFLDSGWILAFQSAIQCHPESGIFGSLLRFPPRHMRTGNLYSGRNALNHTNPSYQHAGGFIPTTKIEIAYAMIRFSLWNKAPLWTARQIAASSNIPRLPGHYHSLNRKHRIHLITAAAMVITPQCIETLGLFDEDFPLAFEDVDYCLRALESGFTPCLVSDATGIHFESLTTRKLEPKKRDSFKIFCDKWPVERVQEAIKGNRGIVHPLFCGCESGITMFDYDLYNEV